MNYRIKTDGMKAAGCAADKDRIRLDESFISQHGTEQQPSEGLSAASSWPANNSSGAGLKAPTHL